MVKYILVIFGLINLVVSNLVINLDESGTYNHDVSLYGPSTINIIGTGLIDAFIKHDDHKYSCINTTNCFQQFEGKCWNIIDLTVTITSKVNNNEITIIATNVINCSLISYTWPVIVAFVVPSFFILVAVVALFYVRPANKPLKEIP